MSEVIIPRQRLFECSALLRDSIEANGLYLEQHPQAVATVGRYVMDRVLPELHSLSSDVLGVSADSVLQTHDGETRPYMNAEFTGRLDGFRICDLQANEYVEGIGPMVLPKTDFVMLFRQRITDPDPVDLGYSEVIKVAMSEMEELRLAS